MGNRSCRPTTLTPTSLIRQCGAVRRLGLCPDQMVGLAELVGMESQPTNKGVPRTSTATLVTLTTCRDEESGFSRLLVRKLCDSQARQDRRDCCIPFVDCRAINRRKTHSRTIAICRRHAMCRLCSVEFPYRLCHIPTPIQSE